jgi:hypothetical protein
MSMMGGGWGVEDRFIAALDSILDTNDAVVGIDDVEGEATGLIIRRGLEAFGAGGRRCSSSASSSLLEDSLSCSEIVFVALERRPFLREAAALAAPRILSSVGGVGASLVPVRLEFEL